MSSKNIHSQLVRYTSATALTLSVLLSCRGRDDATQLESQTDVKLPDISYSYSLRDEAGKIIPYTVTSKTGDSALSIEKLKSFVEQKNIRSIEHLLESFENDPEFSRLLSQFVLMFYSMSEESEAVSPLTPRVLLHADLLFLAFTARFKDAENRQTNPHADTLPLFYFDRVGKTFAPGLFTFRNGKAEFEDKPPSCTRCHGDPAMPIWSPYAVWPGAFGQMDGEIFSVTVRSIYHAANLVKEAKGLTEFIASKSKLDRYRFLKFPAPLVINYKGSGFDDNEGLYKGRLNGAPNTSYTHHLYHLNYWRVLNEVQSSDSYRQYRYAIMGALLDCDHLEQFFPFAMPIDAKTKVREIARSHVKYLTFAERLVNEQGGADHPIEINYGVEVAETSIPKIFGNLAYVLQKTGINPYAWSLTGYPESEGRSLVFNAGEKNESDGSSLLLHEFLKEKLIGDSPRDCKTLARKSREMF